MALEGRQQILSASHNTTIHGGTFANVAGNMVINTMGRSGLELLVANVAQSAFHDAAERLERGDPPRCHTRTRRAILTEIMEWIKAPSSMRKLILWMYGPAGSGKTAIAQSIAEECERQGLLAGSFFFWRSAAERNNASQFVATLAYQLSRRLPQIQEHLNTAIERDPLIFHRSLSTQMRVLVIEPLKLTELSLPVPVFVIVDAVDECGPDGHAQAALLHQLGTVASEMKHFPFLFLVASRPEYEIREVFSKRLLSSLANILVLDNNYEANKDIKRYLNSKFNEIHEKNLRLGSRLPSSWPNEGDVNLLVAKASGQFIFASTIIKYVDSPRHNPIDRLNTVLRLSSTGNETPFAPLDSLYRFILASVEDVEKVLEVLMLLLWIRPQTLYTLPLELPLDKAEELLGFDIRRALVDMHALLDVPPPMKNHMPRMYHASLSDFLINKSRSLEYFIGESRRCSNFARLCLKIIGTCGRSSIRISKAIGGFIGTCATLYPPANRDIVEDLACFNLRVSLEQISDFDEDLYVKIWHNFMDCVENQGGGRNDIFPRLQKDFDTCILDRIGQYPPALLPYVPIMLSSMSCRRDIFSIVSLGVSESAKELNELRKLDKTLLGISSFNYSSEKDNYVSSLLKDAERAGKYFVGGESILILVRMIVKVICAKPGERNYQIRFEGIHGDVDHYLGDGSGSTKRIGPLDRYCLWFDILLVETPIDMDIANLLCERTVQFRNDVQPIPGRKRIAEESIKYIQRCGIPFLEHAHQPHTNECAICTMCAGAVVVENIASTPSEPPVSRFSGADVESVLAFADEFEATPYPSTHMLQF